MSITSDEVNYLIYRYLLESGFSHSSFAFGHESQILNTLSQTQSQDFLNQISASGNATGTGKRGRKSASAAAGSSSLISTLNNLVKPGALISVLQKGLMYMEAEAYVNEDGTEREVPRPFSLLTNQPLPVITSTSASGNSINSKKSIGAINSKKKEKKNAGNYSQARKQQSPRPDAAKMDIDDSSLSRPQPENAFPTSQILILEGHEAEVFKCHWNPSKSLVATGSGDSTVRIWKIPQDISGSSSVEDPVVLKHFGDGEDPKDVTAIRWDATGEFLATGSYTGELRLFSPTGDLLHLEREAHNGPIFSVKWNPSANLVITCGVDSSVCLWRLSEKSLKFLGKSTHHSDPVLEVDWKDDHIFASCSSDKSVQICRISEEMINGDFKASDSNAGSWVLRKFENAHEADVNEVKWSPDGKFLASCSDDGTAKIWSLESESYIHELKGHQKEVFTMDWRPGSEENDAPSQYLATASLDHSVRIWDMKDGKCAKEFSKHKEAVYTLSFSPNGHYLATGGYDCEVMVWDFKTGNTIRQYSGISGIFEVAWNSNGEKLIATFAQNTACVFEFKV